MSSFLFSTHSPSSPAESPRLGRRVLALLFLAWLTWTGVAGVGAIGRELQGVPAVWRMAGALTAEGRIARTMSTSDRIAKLPSGYLLSIVKAVNEFVPPHEDVQLLQVPDRKRIRALVPVPHLTFPRRIRADLFRKSEDVEPPPGTYLLAFGDTSQERLLANKTLLASGADWSLWH